MHVEHIADCFGGAWLKSPLSRYQYATVEYLMSDSDSVQQICCKSGTLAVVKKLGYSG